jgi:hypothetical protein
MTGMPPERCPRCGTARRGDLQVCVRCETSFDDVDLALPRPAAPSPSQSHGTVMVALVAGFVLMAFLLWLSVRGVGPFTARVVSAVPAGDQISVTVTVTNEGSKAGHGKCRIGRVTTGGDLTSEYQFLSARVAPHSTITQTVEVPHQDGVNVTQVAC